ncbi:MAG: hypothetical protein JW891_07120 [Candidatus Lokiarchaeota archaeon]|nr:hypothetical protein [Candidatus Lokiarchaeota archaeon]
MKSGKEVIILDEFPFDLREFENQEIECLIYLMISRVPITESTKDEPKNPILTGKYIGKYKIQKKWNIPEYFKLIYDHIPEYHGIQINDDIFPINPNSLKYHSIQEGDVFTFKSIGLELWAWEPI